MKNQNEQANNSKLEEEIATLRAEKDQLSQSYCKAVRQKQSLVQHIKDLQSEDTELHSLMQSLLQSAHQAVAERDTLERLVKPAGSGGTPHSEGKSSSEQHKQTSGTTQILPQNQPPPQTTLPTNNEAQSGEWNKQTFLSC